MSKSNLLATLGPTLNTVNQIEEAINNGIMGFRLHLGSIQRDNIQYFMNIVAAKRNLGRNDVKVLLDFSSARPRTVLETVERKLEIGSTIRFVDANNNYYLDDTLIKLYDFNRYLYNLKVGEVLEFRGGKLIFSIVSIDLVNECVETICIKAECTLKELNVCTLKHSYVNYYPISLYDLNLIKKMKCNNLIPDYVALSFCTNVKQVKLFRKIIDTEFKNKIKCYAKIENRQGFCSINEISDCVDGLFVARADISNNFPYLYWYDVQKKIADFAYEKKLELCIGSNYLHFFSKNGIINRSEIIDFSIALEQNADWIMLSGETGNSKFSKETIDFANMLNK